MKSKIRTTGNEPRTSVTQIIPFAHSLTPDEERAWIAAVGQALPEGALRSLATLTDDARANAQVAVVANPDPADLARLPALRWVQSLWAGIERLVPQTPPDIAIVRMVDPQLSATMAEAVLAWTLYLHRDMPLYARQQKSRLWRQRDATRAEDRTVAILGLGNMGRAAARRLCDNDFSVLAWSSSPKSVPGVETFSGSDGLTKILKRADIVVILLPLTDATRGLIDADALANMKPGASLINFARGAIVDEAALLARLDARLLDHAVLDVFATEPLPAGSLLWSHQNLTILPHISAPTNVTTASAIVAKNLRTFFNEGRIPDSIDRRRGY